MVNFVHVPCAHLCRIGEVGDLYRPNDSQTFPKEFVFVGFYSEAHASNAIRCLNTEQFINNVRVSAEDAKLWLLELYPRPI